MFEVGSSLKNVLQKQTIGCKKEDFRTYVDSKALTLKLWKWNYYSIIRKSLGSKDWIQGT